MLALQDLRRKTDNLMQPRAIFLDYEAALKKALGRVFPASQLYGDLLAILANIVALPILHGV